MKQLPEWVGLALLVDVLWIYLLFLLRKTKWFMAAWVLGMLITSVGILFGCYMLFMLITLSHIAGEAGLAGVGAMIGLLLSLPFVVLAFLYVRAYRRYQEGNRHESDGK